MGVSTPEGKKLKPEDMVKLLDQDLRGKGEDEIAGKDEEIFLRSGEYYVILLRLEVVHMHVNRATLRGKVVMSEAGGVQG